MTDTNESFETEVANLVIRPKLQNVVESGRICFGLMYYPTKESADRAGSIVRESNAEYNGGWFHGMACGREPSRDYIDAENGQPYYAVTY